jgi:hypothetical protein
MNNTYYFKKIIDIQNTMTKDDPIIQKTIESLIEIEHDRYIKNTSCTDRGVFSNYRNSCYMDSILLPLLSDPPKFIRQEIFAKKNI